MQTPKVRWISCDLRADTDTQQLLMLTGVSLLSTVTFAITPPKTCQTKVFIDGYPDPACVVPNTGPVGVNLAQSLFLAPGECKDAPSPIKSFRNAIDNDAKASTCTLSVYPSKGCQGTPVSQKPNIEANENQCVDLDLKLAFLLGANSFKLVC